MALAAKEFYRNTGRDDFVMIVSEIVKRKASEADRRSVNISLTLKGKKYINEKMKNINGVTREILSRLTDDELEEIAASLTKLRDILIRP